MNGRFAISISPTNLGGVLLACLTIAALGLSSQSAFAATPRSNGSTLAAPPSRSASLVSQGERAVEAGAYDVAKQDFERAAEAGDADAMYNLGQLFLMGQGVTKDPRLALRWYQAAAERGHSSAMSRIAYMFQHGVGVTQNGGIASQWYVQATEHAEADIAAGKARIPELGADCEMGNGKICFSVGYAYAKGAGVSKSKDLSLQYFQKSCDVDVLVACYNIGVVVGSPLPDIAFSANKKACTGGYAKACDDYSFALLDKARWLHIRLLETMIGGDDEIKYVSQFNSKRSEAIEWLEEVKRYYPPRAKEAERDIEKLQKLNPSSK
jgi:TPR repeat protein